MGSLLISTVVRTVRTYDERGGRLSNIPPQILSVSTDLKTLGDAGINFDMTPFQILVMIR